jgi:hypothetical protein
MIDLKTLNASQVYENLPMHCLDVNLENIGYQIFFTDFLYRPKLLIYYNVEQLMHCDVFYSHFIRCQKTINTLCKSSLGDIYPLGDPYLNSVVTELTPQHSRFSIWFKMRDETSNCSNLGDLIMQNRSDLTSLDISDMVSQMDSIFMCLI